MGRKKKQSVELVAVAPATPNEATKPLEVQPPQVPPLEQYVISTRTLQSVVDYLLTKPYKEVGGTLNSLLSEIDVQNQAHVKAFTEGKDGQKS